MLFTWWWFSFSFQIRNALLLLKRLVSRYANWNVCCARKISAPRGTDYLLFRRMRHRLLAAAVIVVLAWGWVVVWVTSRLLLVTSTIRIRLWQWKSWLDKRLSVILLQILSVNATGADGRYHVPPHKKKTKREEEREPSGAFGTCPSDPSKKSPPLLYCIPPEALSVYRIFFSFSWSSS